jgi:hypothetical protein
MQVATRRATSSSPRGAPRDARVAGTPLRGPMNTAYVLSVIARSPDERSDIRVLPSAEQQLIDLNPQKATVTTASTSGFRFAHPGY